MYQPPHFVETRREIIDELIRAHPLGLMISNGPKGPLADAVPFILHGQDAGIGVLRAHVARSNPHWQLLAMQPQSPVLVVFQGPQAYVTPSWYQTKADTGKVVPTWNYISVQVRGFAKIHPEADWLLTQVTSLTDRHEQGRENAWAVSDAPEQFIGQQLRAIVGIEIDINEIVGKWKASQNRTKADRNGVAEGLAELPGEDEKQMAEWVRTSS